MLKPTQNPTEITSILLEGLKSGKAVAYHKTSGRFFALPTHLLHELGPDYITSICAIQAIIGKIEFSREDRQTVSDALKDRAAHIQRQADPTSDIALLGGRLQRLADEILLSDQERVSSLKDQFLFWLEEIVKSPEKTLSVQQKEKGAFCINRLMQLYPEHKAFVQLGSLINQERSILKIREEILNLPLFSSALQIHFRLQELEQTLSDHRKQLEQLPSEAITQTTLIDVVRTLSEPLEEISFYGEHLEEKHLLIEENLSQQFLEAHEILQELNAKRERLRDLDAPLPPLDGILILIT